jgi:NAD-reducing hydrogenase large subunit
MENAPCLNLKLRQPNAGRLRRVAIDPVSRVEGHGKVTLLLDEQRSGTAGAPAYRRIPRLREIHSGSPVLGGTGDGAASVRYLSGVTPPGGCQGARPRGRCRSQLTPSAEKLRRFMHYGQILQSHALHFFYLSSPDLLFGFDSEASRRNIVGVAAAHPEVAKQGVLLRKFGQEVIRLTAGKRVHGTGADSRRSQSGAELARGPRRSAGLTFIQIIGWGRSGRATREEPVHRQSRALRRFRHVPLESSCRWSGQTARSTSTTAACAHVTPTAGTIVDGFAHVKELSPIDPRRSQTMELHEIPLSWPRLGPQNGWYKVGPLARVQNCDSIPTPLADAERREFIEHGARQADPCTAGLPLGAHARDAARRRDDQGSAAR